MILWNIDQLREKMAHFELQKTKTISLDKLKKLIEIYLKPLIPMTIENKYRESTSKQQCISYNKRPDEIAVKSHFTQKEKIILTKSPKFSSEEKKFAHDLITELIEMHNSSRDVYRNVVFKSLHIRSIAKYIGCEKTSLLILEQFENWAARTYEGGAITSSIGIDPTSERNKVHLTEIFPYDFSAVLTNGFDTLLVVNNRGEISGSGQLPSAQLEIYAAPYRLNLIANWASDDRVAIVLNRLGEILIFKNSQLIFIKRSGKWQLFAHEDCIGKLYPTIFKKKLRQSIYETCIDISFARSGGCIIIIDNKNIKELKKLVNTNDRVDIATSNVKSQVISAMIRRTFENLDRRLRQEFLALDGATVLDQTGKIIAVGAIISVPSGSDGGGRRAAALKGSEFGIGIKISEDGEIVAFKNKEIIFTA